MIYEIKRGNAVIWSGKAIGRQYRRIMQEDRVEVTINTASAIKFKKGDTLVAYGQTYKLNRPENISKKNTQIGYSYDIEFEALYYDFGKWILYTLDKNNALKEPAVYLMGDAKAILGLVIQNANRASNGWTLGVIDDTEVFQWTYSGGKLLTVIQDIADQTNLEFWFDNGGKRLNLTRRQPVTGIQLAYGKGNGLYELYRSRRDNPVVTHLTILGGAQNIPNNYGFRNIQPTGGNPMVNPNYVAGMDRVEDTVVYENIYPRLIAKVTATGAPNVIRSTDIDFDLNDHLLDDGTSAQIAFTSGLLNTFKFTVEKTGYDHATRQVTFNIIQDDKAYPGGVPDALLKPAVGDSFVFLNIDMPATYVTNAEGRVKDTGDQYFAEEGVEQFDWSAKITPKFALENNTELVLGGLVHLKADDIGFDGNIRIDSYSRDLQESYRYDFTLSNIISINSLVRQRNQSDRLANTVSKGISSDGLSTKATYAERAGYAGTAGHANTATNAATANFASQAQHAYEADHAMEANHSFEADEADHAKNADYALDSDKWDGYQFDDYLDQPVRVNDNVRHKSVSSPSYTSGATGHGFKINEDGSAEFDSLTVRKELNVFQLAIREITGTGGSWAITNVAKIEAVYDRGGYYSCHINTDDDTIFVPFVAGDLIRCQVWDGQRVKYYTARVIAVSQAIFDIEKPLLDGAGIPEAGDSVFQWGSSVPGRQGLIYMTNSDTGAPYLDVLDQIDSPNLADKTKVRLGKLDGITDIYLGALSGYGLYAQRAYIRGNIWVEGGNAETLAGAQGKADGAYSQAIAYTNTQFQVLDDKIVSKVSQTEVDASIKAIKVGGTNTYSNRFTEVTPMNGANNVIKNHPNSPNAFIVTGSPSHNGVVRLVDVITENGWWTVSGYVRSTQNVNVPFYIDICDNVTSPLILSTSDNQWTYFEYTSLVNNYSSGVYNFVDFSELNHLYYEFKDINVENSNKAASWSPSPRDIEQQFVDVNNRVTTTETQILQTNNNIILSASKTEAYLKQSLNIDYANGKNKWLFVKYDYPQADAYVAPKLEMIKNLTSDVSRLIPDGTTLLAGDNWDNYIGHYRCMVFVDSDRTISFTCKHDDGMTAYVNGIINYEAHIYVDGALVNLVLKTGWNTIDFLNMEGQGGDGISSISNLVSTQVTSMYAVTSTAITQNTVVGLDKNTYDGNFERGFDLWTEQGHFNAGHTIPSTCRIVPNTGINGGNVWRTEGGQGWLYSLKPIPVVRGHRYRVTVRYCIRQGATNHSNTYCGFAQYYADGTTPPNLGLAYFVFSGEHLPGDDLNTWYTKSAEYQMNLSGNNSDIAYIKVAMGFNYGGGNATIDCDSIILEDITQEFESKVYTNSQITIVNDAITAESIRVNSLTGRMDLAEFKLQPDQINLTVSEQVRVSTGKTSQPIDLRHLDPNTSYPVVVRLSGSGEKYRITVIRTLRTDYGVPPYSTHASGFSISMIWTTNGSGWGTQPRIETIEKSTVTLVNDSRGWGNVQQNTMASEEVFYLRGGSLYDVTVEGTTNPNNIILYASGYDWGSGPYTYSAPLVPYTSVHMPEVSYQTKDDIKAGIGIQANGVSVFGQVIALTGAVTIDSLKKGDTNDTSALLTVNGLVKAERIDVVNLFAQSVTATNLTVSGNSKIGDWSIGSGIYSNTNSWGSNQTFSSFSPGDFLMRRNGSNPNVNQDLIEVQMGYLGLGQEIGMKVVNAMDFAFGNNIALALIAKNGRNNIALDIISGSVRGLKLHSEVVTTNANGTYFCKQEYTHHIMNNIVNHSNLRLPSGAKHNEVHMISWRQSSNNAYNLTIQNPDGSTAQNIIHDVGNGAGHAFLMAKNTTLSFIYNGDLQLWFVY